MNVEKDLKFENVAYETPMSKVIEMQCEGVLCLSDGYPNPGYGRAVYDNYDNYENQKW